MALTYYLTIDGLNGGSKAAGHVGAFAIGDFDFDVSALISQASQPRGIGPADFESLTVDLVLNSGIIGLLGEIASGQPISSIRIEGVTTKGQTVYDLTLADVAVTNLHDSRGVDDLDSLTFDYKRFSLTTTPVDATTGALGTPSTFGWNIATNSALETVLPDTVAAKVDTGGSGALDYYLTIDGMRGGSLRLGHQGSFEVGDFDFDVSTLVNAVTGIGPAHFSPLTVELALGSGLAELLDHIADAESFRSVQIQGVTITGQTVYELTLGKVLLTKVHDNVVAGETGVDSVTFDYGQVALTTTPYNPATGALGTPATFGWNIETDSVLATSLHDPDIVGPASVGGSASAYYLTIDGMNGGSQDKNHPGAFEIKGFDFDVTALVDRFQNPGVAPGDFKPLTVDLLLTSGLTGLLGNITSGNQIPSMRIEGVIKSQAGSQIEVYDLLLGGVALTEIHGSNGANDLDRLVFDYKSFSLTMTPLNPNTGQPTTPVTFAWDTIEHDTPFPQITGPEVAGGSGSGGEASAYFLTIAGMNGGSRVKDHVGAFEIKGFDFDVSAIGKAEFSPLKVNLLLASGLTGLIDHMANGQPFSSIRIQGVNAAGQAVYDLRLGDVALTNVHDSNGANELDSLTFDYGQVTLTTTPVTAAGALGKPSTFGWNLETNTAFSGSLPDPIVGKSDSGGSNTDEFYLTIDGLGGESQHLDHKGAFALHGFDLDVSALVARLGQTLDIGRAQFDPLTVNLQLNAGLTGLLDQMAEGKHIPTVRIEGVFSNGSTSTTIYNLTLGDVAVTKIHDSHGEETVDSLTLVYSQFSLTTTALDPNTGFPRAPVTFDWDLKTQNELSAPLPDPVAGSGDRSGGGNLDYFMTIAGLTGDSKNGNHVGAFEIEGFDFDVSALLAVGPGGTVPDFSPLTVDLFLNTGLIGALQHITSSKHIPSLEIEGIVANTKGGGARIYDLKLDDVLLTNIHDASNAADLDSLTFDYSRVTLTMRSVNLDGTPGDATTFTWTINDVNTAPTVALTNTILSLAESTDTSSAIKVADIAITDDGVGTNKLTLAGDDAALFQIVGNALFLKAGTVLDFEGGNAKLDVTVQVDDPTVGATPDDSEALSISVTDANAAPTVTLKNMTLSLAENTDTSSAIKVADIVVSDDSEGTNKLALSGDDAALFQIVGNALFLKAGTALDFESGNTKLDVTVQVDDPTVGVSPDDSEALSISVTDVNAASTLALKNTTLSLAENTDTSSALKVADIVIGDDGEGTNKLALSGDDAALFQIVGNALFLKAGTVLDYESGNTTLDVTVQVDDPTVAGTPDDSEALSISVIDVNAPPTVALTNTTLSLAENTDISSRLKVADITVTDDGEGSHELSLSGDDAALFEIVGNALYLKAGTVLDFESGNTTLDIAVQVDDPTVAGTPDDSEALSISVIDVNAPPTVALTNATVSLAENIDTSSRLKVADITVTDDGEGSDGLSLSGDDAALFEIVDNALYLKAGTLLDYESGNTTLDVAVQVDDPTVAGTPGDSAALSIAVTDVNAAPTLALAVAITSLAETVDTSGRLKVAEITITDDGEGLNGLMLTGDDATLFEIFGSDLYLKAGTVLDFESGNTRLDVTVQLDDPTVGGSPDDSESVSIVITNVAGKIIDGGNGGQALAGTGEEDAISGGNGNDVLNGEGGNDSLSGGNGTDVLIGGAGNDALDAGNGDDVLNGDAGNDTLSGGNGIDVLSGGAGNDSLDAGNGDDVLKGDAGDDILSGGNGADILIGGAGNDSMEGGTGNDVFLFAAGFGNDRILGFDATPAGGQDYLDISAFGIAKADFAARVAIADVGADTLVTIDGIAAQTIRLVGIGDATTVTQADFLL